MDIRCSGRHQCKFSVADPDVGLLNTKPCPKDFSPYLEASYVCNKGKTIAESCKTCNTKRKECVSQGNDTSNVKYGKMINCIKTAQYVAVYFTGVL